MKETLALSEPRGLERARANQKQSSKNLLGPGPGYKNWQKCVQRTSPHKYPGGEHPWLEHWKRGYPWWSEPEHPEMMSNCTPHRPGQYPLLPSAQGAAWSTFVAVTIADKKRRGLKSCTQAMGISAKNPKWAQQLQSLLLYWLMGQRAEGLQNHWAIDYHRHFGNIYRPVMQNSLDLTRSKLYKGGGNWQITYLSFSRRPRQKFELLLRSETSQSLMPLS